MFSEAWGAIYGVASVEAFTGAFNFTLFVLVFGRKMIR